MLLPVVYWLRVFFLAVSFSQWSSAPAEGLTVGPCAPLMDPGLHVHKHGSGSMFASPGLAEDRTEPVILLSMACHWHLVIKLISTFKAIQFPAGMTVRIPSCPPWTEMHLLLVVPAGLSPHSLLLSGQQDSPNSSSLPFVFKKLNLILILLYLLKWHWINKICK